MSNFSKNGFLCKLYEFIEYNEENKINCINWYKDKDKDKKGFKIKDNEKLIKKLNENNITKGKLGSFYRQLNYYNIFNNKNDIYYHKNNLFYKGNYNKINLIKRDNYKKSKYSSTCSICKKRRNNGENNIITKKQKKIYKIKKKYLSVDIMKLTNNFLNMELKLLEKQKLNDDMRYISFINSKKHINEMFDYKVFDKEFIFK